MRKTENLKLDDVYESLYDTTDHRRKKVYCPQCGHKTLRNGRRLNAGGYHVFWACTHNMQPRTWRGERHNRKPCDLVIQVPGRDATPNDFGGVLGLMSKIHIPQIKQWLLNNDGEIHARGMKVIYEGPLFDVVRRRVTSSGVGAGLYWKRRTYERDDETLFDPNDNLFSFARSEAAHYVNYKGFQAAYLFDKGKYVELWQQDEDEEKAVFKGARCGKRMQKEIVEFCKAFEVDIPEILMRCKQERARWAAEKRKFQQDLEQHVAPRPLRLEMQHYSGETRQASFCFPHVRPATAARIEALLDEKIPFVGLSGATRTGLTFDEAQKVEDLLGIKYSVNLMRLSYSRHYDIDTAKALAKIISEDQS